MTTLETSPARKPWQPLPAVIVICGCAVALLSFGPRSALGLFLTPMSVEYHWGRDVFSTALAMQNLLWGAAQPFAGAFADRYGAIRVICGGAVLYGLGLLLMAFSGTPATLDLSAGVLIGFGLAGSSFTLVLAAFGKLLPEAWRSLAFGAGTAAGSFGQFLFSPLAVALQGAIGWQGALMIFAALCLVMVPLSLALAAPRSTAPARQSKPAAAGFEAPAAAPSQSLTQVLSDAFRHPSYLLLVLGFFTCGFQLAFISIHLPAYLADKGISADVGGKTLGVIGLFNIIGSLGAGWLGSRMPKRYILSANYLIRALAVLAFITFPVTPASAIVFGAVMGLMWLSTVPPTNGLIATMFGTRWLAMLAGFAFFSHQVGGFLGVLIGGYAYEHTGSYDVVWWLSILFGVLSAVVNLPIVEKPAARVAAAQA
jgi:MFS family permease